MAQPFATEADAREAYAGDTASPARLRAVMTGAAGMVLRLAPAPDPAEADLAEYAALAADAELLAGEWLWATGGYIERDSVFDSSTQYGGYGALEDAIRALMGPFVPAGSGSGEQGPVYDVAVLSTFHQTGPAVPAWNVNDPQAP